MTAAYIKRIIKNKKHVNCPV